MREEFKVGARIDQALQCINQCNEDLSLAQDYDDDHRFELFGYIRARWTTVKRQIESLSRDTYEVKICGVQTRYAKVDDRILPKYKESIFDFGEYDKNVDADSAKICSSYTQSKIHRLQKELDTLRQIRCVSPDMH